MRSRRVARFTAACVAAYFCGLGVSESAAAFRSDFWKQEEQTYLKKFPAIVRPAEQALPYTLPFMRMMFLAGAVGAFYANHPNICPILANDPRGFSASAAKQLFTGGTDTYLAQYHLTRSQVLIAYVRGVAFACARR